MFVTSLSFGEIINRFYLQDDYDFLLLFVSSFDGSDADILRKVVDNAKRIDRITGSQICFFYFVEDRYDWMNERLTRWVNEIPSYAPLYGQGVNVTMNMADEICQYFGLLRSYLPAFILIERRDRNARIYSIQNYIDFEAFLTPLNIIHSYIEDKEYILKQFEQNRRAGIVTQQEADMRSQIRHSWNVAIQQLEKKQDRENSLGMVEKAESRRTEILKFKNKLNENPLLKVKGVDETILYPDNDLFNLENNAIRRLEIALNSDRAKFIIESINSNNYQDGILEIWSLIGSKKVRLSNVLDKIRMQINERGFDIFISCKSQDYAKAHELFDYLKRNGYNPFLADASIKEVGVDQYTALIGEVINVCQSMIVFATDVDYLQTPYVYAEWNSFINDINTGRKPNAKIINIISSDINEHRLPLWLRDKQCFTIESYKTGLLSFLKGVPTIIQLCGEFQLSCDSLTHRTKNLMSEITSLNIRKMLSNFIDKIQYNKNIIEYQTELLQHSQDASCIKELCNKINQLSDVLHDEFNEIIDYIDIQRREETHQWDIINENPSVELLMDYLERYPEGAHAFEIDRILNRKVSSEGISFCPSIQHSKNKWLNLFRRRGKNIYSSVFTPAQIQPMNTFIVRVYLYKQEESEPVDAKVKSIDPNAQKKEYKPLDIPVKKGDKLTVRLKMSDGVILESDTKTIIWHNHFSDCSFMAKLTDILADNVFGTAYVYVNGVPAGELLFTIDVVVSQPKNLYAKVESRRYSRIFISYSHADEIQVRGFAECCRALGTDYFFDRHTLQAGDIFKEKIFHYINNADLFVLCWSKNAAESEWVQIEREHALSLIKEGKTKLFIYPLSLKPEAPLPLDMSDIYNFGTL